MNELRRRGRWDGRWRQGLLLPPPRIHHAALVLRQSRQCRRTGRRAKPFYCFMLNVAHGPRSLASGGVLCRPGQRGEERVWGVSDPSPETRRRPQPRPRGSLTPHVSQQVSQRFCRRRSTHMCSEITDAISIAAARACDVRSGRSSQTPRRRLCSAFLGASFRHRHMACETPRRQALGSACATPTCRPSRLTAWRCARRRPRRCAPLRPPRSAGPAGLDGACAQPTSWLLRDAR